MAERYDQHQRELLTESDPYKTFQLKGRLLGLEEALDIRELLVRGNTLTRRPG